MPMTRDELIKVAHLARLKLSEDELSMLAKDLERITDYVGQLSDIPIDDSDHHPVLPLIRTHDGMRNDQARQWFDSTQATAGAPRARDGYFRVPPVIDKLSGDSENEPH